MFTSQRHPFHAFVLAVGLAFTALPGHVMANGSPNVVTEWSTIAQQAIHSATAPRSAGTSEVLHAMVSLAIYDAVVAIEGGYEPYAVEIQAPPGADIRAAVATAAYRTARPRILPARQLWLDEQYAAYLATIPDGPARTAGVWVGEQAAAAMLARRANDRFSEGVPYWCSTAPPPVGEFEPDSGCPSSPSAPQPVDAKLGQIQPFTYADPIRFRPDGPEPLSSTAYAEEFAETRDYGRIDSIIRTAEQTDIAYFWSENPYVHWNRNLVNLAVAQGLDVAHSARLFAMVHTTAADAIIAGFAAKYYYIAWRPRTAIPQADLDGNPDTDPDPTWKPLLSVNHPEYPSGHGFWSTAVIEAVANFFGSNRVTWTIVTSKAAVPALVQTERTYTHLNELRRQIGDARVWGGLHWRHAIRHGEQIGRRVFSHVNRKAFRPR